MGKLILVSIGIPILTKCKQRNVGSILPILAKIWSILIIVTKRELLQAILAHYIVQYFLLLGWRTHKSEFLLRNYVIYILKKTNQNTLHLFYGNYFGKITLVNGKHLIKILSVIMKFLGLSLRNISVFVHMRRKTFFFTPLHLIA